MRGRFEERSTEMKVSCRVKAIQAASERSKSGLGLAADWSKSRVSLELRDWNQHAPCWTTIIERSSTTVLDGRRSVYQFHRACFTASSSNFRCQRNTIKHQPS